MLIFYTAILCVVYKDNPNKRRYETGVLEICRKNFKTYTIATLFIILFLSEPQFSKFYSVAPDGSLSKEIREAIAENAHDVWAVERMTQGWTYGPKRDDDKKETPCMVPYSQLPESEKKFDRDMAESSLKLVKAVGYDIIKKEDTEIYRLLKQRLLEAKEEYHCPECKGLVFKHQVFCDHCGKKLEIDWNFL